MIQLFFALSGFALLNPKPTNSNLALVRASFPPETLVSFPPKNWLKRVNPKSKSLEYHNAFAQKETSSPREDLFAELPAKTLG